MSHTTANISGLAAIMIWCLTPVMLAGIDMPPFLLGAVSFLAAFAVACGWWLYKGESIAKKFVMPLSSYALGTYGICLYNVLYIYSFKTGPTLEVNLLNYLWPAFMIVFSCVELRKMPDIFAVSGIALCLAGVFFVFASHGLASFSGDMWMLAAGIVCGLMWGSYSSLSKYVSKKVDQIAVFFLIAGAVMLALHFVFEETVWPMTMPGWLFLAAYTLARFAFFLWDNAMRHGQARVIGSLSYFIPLLATFALVSTGAVSYNTNLLTGAALITGGCIIINLPSIVQNLSSKWKAFA